MFCFSVRFMTLFYVLHFLGRYQTNRKQYVAQHVVSPYVGYDPPLG